MSTNSFKNYTIGSFIILLFIVSCSSVKKNSVQKDFIGSNEFVFIEMIQTQEGFAMKGESQQGRRIDSPTYRFNSDTKQLQILRKDNLSLDSIKILLGNVRVLSGSAGTGVSSRLKNITKLPHTENNLTIKNVDKKGICLVYDKQEFILEEGKEWKTSITKLDTIKADQPTITKTIITHKIQYKGKFSKSSITGLTPTQNR